MNERQIRDVIESVLLKLASGALALGTLVGCSGPSHRPDPNPPPGPDVAQVADAGPAAATPDARPALSTPPEEEPQDWRLRRRRRRVDPNAPPMPYMAPDAAPLRETLS
jgi:hypothetical protein